MFEKRSNQLSIEELRALVAPIAEQNGISHVMLFGSRSRGDFTADSDYDFLVDVVPGAGLLDLGCFSEELEEALGVPVSIVDEMMVSETFMRSIRPDLREIYG